MKDSYLETSFTPETRAHWFQHKAMDRNVGQDQHARGARELEVVSIVWMGGIGKTTLANKIYNDQFIMSQFEIRAKVTVVLTQIRIQMRL
ncbi:hypothetical protein RDI58_001730 [Solanum bulbocastanum]|uniref:NB-ARC domain-containing protein n=1 Tax=Solanum bulbocastanum TaxID=147425 RepID=A0AAN8UEU8_SOLBU